MKRLSPHRNTIASFGIAIGFLMFAALLGVGIGVLPTGFSARLAILVFAVSSLFIAWAFRANRNRVPEGLVFTGVCLLTVLSVLWPRYVYFHTAGLPGVNLLTVSTMAGLFVVVTLLVFSPRFSTGVFSVIASANWIAKIVGIWFVWRLFACFVGTEPVYSLLGFARELVYLSSFLLFGFVLAALPNGSTWLYRLLLLSGVAVGVAGIVEAFSQHNWFVQFATAGEGGDQSGSLAGIAAEKIRFGAFRAQSTFDHPIVFAQFVAALVPLAIYAIWQDKSKFWKLVALVALPVALLALLKAGSRAGHGSVLVAFALIGLVLWLRALVHGKFSKAFAIVALPALVAGIGIAYLIIQDLALGRVQHEASSTAVRLVMLRQGIAALEDSPLWGFGHGMALYKAGVVNVAGFATIDNYLLSIALDSGYVGLALFFLFLAVFAVKSLSFAVREPGPTGLFVGACLASVLAIMATFSVLSIPNNMTLMWLLMTATFPYLGHHATAATKPKPR